MSRADRMPRAFLLLLGATLLALGGVLWTPGCGGGSPITVSPSTYDFGRVLKGDKPTHLFTLTNHSDRIVGFKAQPNCACFAVAQGLRPLDPGESLQFRVLFDTTALPPQKVKGKWITIHTDHPDAPGLLVPLEGEIYQAFSFIPASFNLGRIDGRPMNYETRVVNIRPLENHELRITNCVSAPAIFDVEPKALPGGGFDVSITLQKEARRPVAPFAGAVHLDMEVTAPDGKVRIHRLKVHLSGFWVLKDNALK